MAELANREAVSAVSRSNQVLSGKIVPEMVTANGVNENLVASPFSLTSVLSMLYAGSGGDTAKQIRTALALPEDNSVLLQGFEGVTDVLKSDGHFTLETANKLYAMTGFPILQSFLDTTTKYFKASAENLDFAKSVEASGIINHWVEGNTNEKIKDLIPADSLSSDTRLVMVNAVYFKGSWADKFDKGSTVTEDFHLSGDGETVKVDMMHRYGKYAWVVNVDLDCKILQIPYAGDRLSMIFFLSQKPEDFGALEKKLSSFDVSAINMKRKSNCDVAIPKFKLETSHTLVEPLKRIGLTSMFEKGAADLSKISAQGKDLFVSQVVQKAFVEVTEEGTEAAAATGMMIELACYVPPGEFHCNRPFLFVIKDNLTGMVLFTGRVVNPKKN